MRKDKFTRILSAVMAAAILLACLSSCGNASQEGDDGKISIVATIFAQYDFARQIAGDKADITLLLKPGTESHSYEPSPKDIISISNCDLLLTVGGESESWMDYVLDSIDTSDIKIVAAMECVETIEEEHSEGMQSTEHSDEDEEEEEEYDEHVWTSPVNAISIVRAITQELCAVDPDNSGYYSANAEAYIAQLEELDGKFRELVENAERKTLIFGDRFPLLYFVKEYSLDYYAAFPGCSSETEPSAATVAFMVDKVRSEGYPVVFYIELSNHRVADAIAECTGAKALQFNTCHNISADDFEAGETYLSLMTANLDVLKEALY